jgi:hypothetical protein
MADHSGRLARREDRPDELDRLARFPQLVGIGDAAGQDEAVVVVRVGLADGAADRGRSPLSRWLKAWTSPPPGARMSASAPAAWIAFSGSVNSTRSTPSLAIRKAILFPCS